VTLRERLSFLATVLLSSRYGVSLIELLIGLAIASLIAGTTVVAIHQILTASAQANDMQLANSQVRAAEHWMTRDILSAHSADAGTGGDVFLRLLWTDASATDHTVQYIAEQMPNSSLHQISRVYDDSSSTFVASHIDLNQSEWELVDATADNGALKVTLVAVARSYAAVRTFEVKPRSD
jgi:prepilin-type N-terminal cleavage/methylation domain-containing protein